MGLNYRDINSNLNTLNRDVIIDTELNAIDNAIKNILTTRKGELPGYPEFGTNIADLLFEFKDEITYTLIRTMVFEELDRFEPRIRVENVLITSPTPDSEVVLATIEYVVLNLNDLRNETIVEITI